MRGKLITVGTTPRVLMCQFNGPGLVVEEHSIGGTLSAIIEETTVTCNHSDSIKGGEYFIINSPSNSFYIYYTKYNRGEDPLIQHSTGLAVNVVSNDDATAVATKTAAVLDAVGAFDAVAAAEVITVTCTEGGEVTAPYVGSSGFLIEVTVEGISKVLFDNTLGMNVSEVVDLNVGIDGSAEILVIEKFTKLTQVAMKTNEITKERSALIVKPAGWLFV